MGTRVPRNTQAPLTLFGWRSTASHVSQFVIWSLHFHTAYVYFVDSASLFLKFLSIAHHNEGLQLINHLTAGGNAGPSSSDG